MSAALQAVTGPSQQRSTSSNHKQAQDTSSKINFLLTQQ
jgi:hypothetical protein